MHNNIQRIKNVGCIGSIVILFSTPILFSIFSILTSLFWNMRYDEEFWGIYKGAAAASCLFLSVISFFGVAARLFHCKWINRIKQSWQWSVVVLLSLICSIATYVIIFVAIYNSCSRPDVLVKTPVYDFYESGNYRQIFYPDGTRYEGTGRIPSRGSVWRKHGKGTFYKANGIYRTETWENDVLISYGEWQMTKKTPNSK